MLRSRSLTSDEEGGKELRPGKEPPGLSDEKGPCRMGALEAPSPTLRGGGVRARGWLRWRDGAVRCFSQTPGLARRAVFLASPVSPSEAQLTASVIRQRGLKSTQAADGVCALGRCRLHGLFPAVSSAE